MIHPRQCRLAVEGYGLVGVVVDPLCSSMALYMPACGDRVGPLVLGLKALLDTEALADAEEDVASFKHERSRHVRLMTADLPEARSLVD